MGKNEPKGRHTPGPWIVDVDKDGGHWEYRIRTSKPHNPAGGPGKHIATVNAHMQAMGEDNAALIAAAPDLLAACQSLLAAREDGQVTEEEWDAIRAALARAEGGAA